MNKKIYELTNPQKSIWFTEEYFKGTSMENICGSVIFSKEVNFEILEKAINKFVTLNDSFRLRFFLDNGELKQYVSEPEYFSIKTFNVNSKEHLKELERDFCDTTFNITESLLFRFNFLKFENGHGGFNICFHHLIADAWTSGFGASEIIEIYTQLLKDENSVFEPNPSYIDYINSEKEYLSSPKFEKDKAFWLEKYSTIPEIASIPAVDSVSSNSLSVASREQFVLSTDTVELLNAYCKENKFSVFNLFMAVLAIYVGRTSNLDDFVLGSPILNRTNYKEKHTTGMFISTVPLRINLNHESSFVDFASQISKEFFSIFKHTKYPYQYLLEELRKTENIPNLYNILLSYQNIRSSAQNDETPFEISWVSNKYTADEIDIHLYDMNDTGSITLAYDYQINKYSHNQIESIHKSLMHIIKQILDNNSIYLKDIEIVTPEEKFQILNEFNNTKADFPNDKTIAQLFEEQAQKNPDNVAVVFENQKLTYKELNEKSNSLAHYLIDNGITEGDVVTLFMSKNLHFIISIFALFKIGAAYLPINPTYPIDRVNFILNDSKSKLLLTDVENTDLSFANTVNIKSINFNTKNNEHINSRALPTSLAYIIYTSGSTGNPKGVMIKHSNLINFIFSFNKMFNNKFSVNDIGLSLTNISFDVSVCEIFVPLAFGASLVLYPENVLTNIRLLCDTIINENITFLYLPPNILLDVYSALKKSNAKICINKLLVGVEAIKSQTLNKYYDLNPNIEIVNGYGPTETTICATFHKYESCDKDFVVPIGAPLSNNKIFILHKTGNLQPLNVPGELYICGNNVGSGYLNNTELTNSCFNITNQYLFSPSYKTGDFAYIDSKLNVNFVGRKDSQIKFKGYRIELR